MGKSLCFRSGAYPAGLTSRLLLKVLMKSFRQMTTEGTLKRADAEKIRIGDIHFEAGFNPPGRTDSEPDEDDEELFQYIMGGGKLPDLDVRPREGGGVYVVDGHRRLIALRRAVDAGLPMQAKDGAVWIGVKQFVGNDLDRKLHVANSNKHKTLTALQLGYLYRDANVWASVAEIARRVHKSDTHVAGCIALTNGNSDVQAMIKSGEVSATLAGAVVKEHGEAAGAVLAAAKAQVNAKGKTRITAATVKPKKPSQDSIDAARYRWLRNGDNDELVMARGPVDPSYVYLPRNEKLDELIDGFLNKA